MLPHQISVSRRGAAGGDPERTVVWVRGEHDTTTNASLADSIARAAQLEDVPLLIDLSAVTFMDASTVGAIVASRNRLRSHGQSLEVRAPSAPARRVLELCGLAHLIQPEPVQSMDGAIALASWVDVLPVASAGRNDRKTRITAGPGTRAPVHVLIDADDHVEEAVVPAGADRDGP
jgi:anti-sigma B factor antagonist